jgi:acyl-coenzyme A thioesterase PaaI-like protein
VSGGFGRLADALRTVQDLAASTAPPDAVSEQVADRLAEVAELLAPYQVPEAEQRSGRSPELPARGQTLAPVRYDEKWDDGEASASVVFSRFHVGAGAVHGGMLALLFDEVLGTLANIGRDRSRTAFLHVNYRSIARIGAELRVAARIERTEGRKCFVSGTLHDGDTLVADAEGLWVVLRPGQP